MALDYGARRIGIAITDSTGSIAQPLETVVNDRRRSGLLANAALERIAGIARDYEVGCIVVGLPLHLDGRSGAQAQACRRFGERVAQRTNLPVEFLDERWSTLEATRALESAGMSSRQRRGRVDPIAAALVLRTWLERNTP